MMTFLAAITGLMLGVFFYGGLWFTVQRLPAARHPVVLTLGSFWIRLLVVLGGFLLVTHGSWVNAVVCLIGLLCGRVVVSRRVRCT